MKRITAIIAVVLVLASLTITAMTVLRLIDYDNWNRLPPRLSLVGLESEEIYSPCASEESLQTLVDGRRVWTVCRPSEKLPNGGLALTDTEKRSYTLGWSMDEALTLFEVMGAVFTPENELVLVYRGGEIHKSDEGYSPKQSVVVGIAGVDGWHRKPEQVLDSPATPLGMIWQGDHLELVLYDGGEKLFLVKIPGAPAEKFVTEPLDRGKICDAFYTCQFLGAYWDATRWWRFVIKGLRNIDLPQGRDKQKPGEKISDYWDVGLSGGEPEIRTGPAMDKLELERCQVGVIEDRYGPMENRVWLQSDGRWIKSKSVSEYDAWSTWPGGHFRRDGTGLERYSVWQNPQEKGQFVHWLDDRRVYLSLSQNPMGGLPLMSVRTDSGLEAVTSFRSSDAQALQYGHFVQTEEGWLLLGGGLSYLAFDKDLHLIEPRNVFAYLHQADNVNAYGIYWVLFGLVLCGGLGAFVGVLISRRRKPPQEDRGTPLFIGLATGALIHGVVSVWWLMADIWHWLS